MNKQIDKVIIRKFADTHGISLVVLFGSQATGKTHRESDVDIAFLSHEPKTLMEVAAMHYALSEELGIHNLELVDLRGKSPLFLKQVAEKGIPLYEGDHSAFANFTIYAYKRYFEAKPLFALRARSLKQFLISHASV